MTTRGHLRVPLYGPLELRNLAGWVLDVGDGSEGQLGNGWLVWTGPQAQDALLNVRSEPQQGHYLRDPGPGEAFASGDGGLAGDFTSVELASPLAGLKERADDWRNLGPLRWFGGLGLASALGDGADHTAGGHRARQGAHVAVLEGPLGPQGDLKRLFAEFERTLDVVGSDVDNTKHDFRDDPSGLTEGTPGSHEIFADFPR